MQTVRNSFVTKCVVNSPVFLNGMVEINKIFDNEDLLLLLELFVILKCSLSFQKHDF